MNEPRCRFVSDEWPHVLDTHVPTCTTPGCEGCEPCGRRHCEMCGRRHLDDHQPVACARCVGAVRQGVDAILDRSAQLLTEAVHRGVRSEAAMLAGPAADVRIWRIRYNLAMWAHPDVDPTDLDVDLDDPDVVRARDLARDWLDDNRDEPHPAYLLATWDLEVCEHLGHTRTLKASPAAAAAYIKAHLTDLAQDREFAFEELAADVRECVAHLEAVLHDVRLGDTGAPCPACTRDDQVGPRLRKDYEPFDLCPWPRPANWVPKHDDRWKCPRCKRSWTDTQYRGHVDNGYVAHSDRLTASQIEKQYRVKEATVWQWARRGKVRRRGRDQSGRTLYAVDDVLAQRDRTSITEGEIA